MVSLKFDASLGRKPGFALFCIIECHSCMPQEARECHNLKGANGPTSIVTIAMGLKGLIVPDNTRIARPVNWALRMEKIGI